MDRHRTVEERGRLDANAENEKCAEDQLLHCSITASSANIRHFAHEESFVSDSRVIVALIVVLWVNVNASRPSMVRYADGTVAVVRCTMQWDPAHCAKPVALNGATAVHHGGSTWSSVQCGTWLSSGVWEIVVQTDDVDRPSLFLGVVTKEHWAATQELDEDGEAIDSPMRDSPHAICMHGDGRVMIKTQEKDWGLMRMTTEGAVSLTLDFESGLLTFKLAHTDRRGQLKETLAEVPGLFGECTLAACFGGKGQRLTVVSCIQLEGSAEDVARRGDAFALHDRVDRITLDGVSDEDALRAQEVAVALTLA